MSARIDWSQGPVPCVDCGRPMRPSHVRRAEWPGTLTCHGHGRCSSCAAKLRRAEAQEPEVPATPTRYVWESAIPAASSIPQAHWVTEAQGAVARALRERRLVLTARPDITLVHGRTPRIRCVCPVRPMTDTEAAALARRGLGTGDPA
ncbi:hypothetical protein CWT12_12420 [Actinomyces sp. 432]|uniref:hypothetical protein n=1 Tax=Actinomyces sp. 432 TaxID=2057798 RepID=UPI001373F28D|nr:hypothetical protein [Actinomyces sp. 432]QHO91955.1 hypothetical protein CWT12_12420 [Actinomyces sp. 432]